MKINNFDIHKTLNKNFNFCSKLDDKSFGNEPNEINNSKDSLHKRKTFVTAAVSFTALAGGYVMTKGKIAPNIKETISKNRDVLFNKILINTDKYTENVLSRFDFAQFGKDGIPLKYSRDNFVLDLNSAILHLDSVKQTSLLKKFGLEKAFNGGINGVPVFNAKPDGTKEFDDVLYLLKKFTIDNESTIQNPQAKEVIDSLIKGLPEFTMMIGKRQHGTHIYSVDIHSLLVLQKAMNNSAYTKLNDESKLILKMTAFLHDFGKMEEVITTGHASLSKVMAKNLLKDINLSQDVKKRILKQVENHHWFEYYNKGLFSADDVVKMFGKGENLDIAKILAKADFEGVNPGFHLNKMNPYKALTQAEFDDEFALKMAQIGVK